MILTELNQWYNLDEDGEKGTIGFSKKLRKFMEDRGPNMGNPEINDRIVKLIDEVAELNGIVFNWNHRLPVS